MSTDTADATLDVRGFIRACIEGSGGAVEEGGPGRLDALLPPGLESAAGGRAWVNLACEHHAVGGDTEPAMLGSPFLDSLIAHATARGTVAEGHLPAGRLRRRGLRAEAEKVLLFSNCRTRYLDDEADVRLAASAQFDFRVAFVSEERRERLYVVPVNLSTGSHDPWLAARLAGLPVRDDTDVTLPEAPRIELAAAYEAAGDALRRMVGEDAARQQARVRRRFAVQFARIDEYYGRAIEGLERRRARERHREGDGFASKLEAARLERERKLCELGETYGIRTRARLASVRLLWQPKVFFKVLIDRGPTTRALTLAYDGLQERLEPPACEACRQPTARLRATSAARLLCPACVAGGRE